ncbi:hypothetical protein ES702_00881 [subsurface metagenome]
MPKEAEVISKPAVRPEDRESNEVDELLKRVRAIRSGCPHDFRLLAPHNLQESLVEGIYQAHHAQGFQIRCLKCSRDEHATVTVRCLNCFKKPMMPSEQYEDLLKYFSQDSVSEDDIEYMEARIFKCEHCGFTIVVPELHD